MNQSNEETIVSGIEPEIREKLISRRQALLNVGKLGLGALSAPLAVGILSKDAFGQGVTLPKQPCRLFRVKIDNSPVRLR